MVDDRHRTRSRLLASSSLFVLGLVYALGLGLQFIALAVGFGRMRNALAALRRNGPRLQLAGGGLLVRVGVAIAIGLRQRWKIALRPLIQGVELPI